MSIWDVRAPKGAASGGHLSLQKTLSLSETSALDASLRPHEQANCEEDSAEDQVGQPYPLWEVGIEQSNGADREQQQRGEREPDAHEGVDDRSHEVEGWNCRLRLDGTDNALERVDHLGCPVGTGCTCLVGHVVSVVGATREATRQTSARSIEPNGASFSGQQLHMSRGGLGERNDEDRDAVDVRMGDHVCADERT